VTSQLVWRSAKPRALHEKEGVRHEAGSPGRLVVALFAAPAAASERHFTYTYESGVLSPGAREVEPWSTFRLGKSDFYSRFDSRIEAELGLTDRLQTAFYLNMKAVTADTPAGRSSSTELEGISSEWKFKLSDPVADRVGAALYGELSAGPPRPS
jgi:hypothetical protein